MRESRTGRGFFRLWEESSTSWRWAGLGGGAEEAEHAAVRGARRRYRQPGHAAADDADEQLPPPLAYAPRGTGPPLPQPPFPLEPALRRARGRPRPHPARVERR